MARAKPELRPSGIASGLRLLGGRSKLAGLDKFLLGMPANLKVSLNIYPVEMSQETHRRQGVSFTAVHPVHGSNTSTLVRATSRVLRVTRVRL
jgi:hypothetical protein